MRYKINLSSFEALQISEKELGGLSCTWTPKSSIESPNYGLRAKSGPRSYFIRPAEIIDDEKVIYLRKFCWFGGYPETMTMSVYYYASGWPNLSWYVAAMWGLC